MTGLPIPTAPLTIGIISFAHPHAESYARALLARGARVLATDPQERTDAVDHPPTVGLRGADLAARLGIDYHDTVETLLAAGPDAVIVATENALHRRYAEQALRAGVPVLCEKPLATTIEDAVALIEAADAAGVPLLTAYPVRFAPQLRELVGRVRAGELGTIVAINGTNTGKLPGRPWFTDPALAGGGALMDHVVHCADLVDVLLGESASEVYARANRILHAGVATETGGLVSIAYPSGVIATIDCSWSQPDSAPTWGGLTLEVHGTAGSMRVDPFAEHIAGYDADGALVEPVGADLDGLLIDAFLAAIARGSTAPADPDGRVGLRSFAVADAARRSAASGRPEPVSLPRG